jgi:hypothetical protein
MMLVMRAVALGLLILVQGPTVTVGHKTDILHVQFSPDARQVLSYSAGDGWLILWDINTKRAVWQAKTDAIQKAREYHTLTTLAFSPSGDRIASGSGNGTVQLWDARTGRLLWRADAHGSLVSSVAFTPNGESIAASGETEARHDVAILRATDGQVLRRLDNERCVAVGLAFTSDGAALRAGNAGGALVQWNLATGERSSLGPPWRCRGGYQPDWETFFTPDLKTSVTRTGEREATVRDSRTGEVKSRLDVQAYRLQARLDARGGQVVSDSYDGVIAFDLSTGSRRSITSRSVAALDVSPDGALIAVGGRYRDTVVTIADRRTGTSQRLDGQRQRVTVPPPTGLEVRLLVERDARRKALDEDKGRRDRQAALDLPRLRPQITIAFEHFGDMVPLGQLRIGESGEPDMSRTRKPAAQATAAWLRLRNASPLPIRIPTQTMFAVPLDVLKDGRTLTFAYVFLAETVDGRMDTYGHETQLRITLADLRARLAG